MRFTTISIFILLSIVGGARADGGSDTEHRTLQGFADANPSCREWSDGCAVCLRHDAGNYDCSLPGIACLPRDLTCLADRPPNVAGPPVK